MPMVFHIHTRAGFEAMTEALGRTPSPAWLEPGVLSEEEILAFRQAGLDLTVFVASRDPFDRAVLLDHVSTIQLHHLGAQVWVEMPPEEA